MSEDRFPFLQGSAAAGEASADRCFLGSVVAAERPCSEVGSAKAREIVAAEIERKRLERDCADRELKRLELVLQGTAGLRGPRGVARRGAIVAGGDLDRVLSRIETIELGHSFTPQSIACEVAVPGGADAVRTYIERLRVRGIVDRIGPNRYRRAPFDIIEEARRIPARVGAAGGSGGS